MRILALETSCDETSIALVDCKGTLRQAQGSKLRFEVLKNIVSSQIKIHRPFGGVVPNLAKREHIKNLPLILKKLKTYNLKLITDAIAVTVGPGLEPALWAGIEFAKNLAKKLKKPLLGVNHLEGHLHSNVLKNVRMNFPAVALLVSGGHTILLKMDSLTKWKKLGETRDDAAGEAFDKVARLLNLPYPGGPEIEKIAKKGNPRAINFPRPMLNPPAGGKNYDFSFSGLKTAVLYYLRDVKSSYGNTKTYESTKKIMDSQNDCSNNFRNFVQFCTFVSKADIAASFQQAAIDVLIGKTMRAAREFGVKSVLLCGGVAANKSLRAALEKETKKLYSYGRVRVAGAKGVGAQFVCPDFKYNTDNAAMIAAAAYIQKLRGKKLRITAQSNLTL